MNYNRTEPPLTRAGKPNPGGGIKDEKPIASKPFEANVVVPKNRTVRSIQLISPDFAKPMDLGFHVSNDAAGVSFEVPPFLVYAVARIQWE